MSFEVRFGIEAGITYEAVVAQLNKRWGEKFVLKFEGKVKRCIKILTSNPYLYPVFYEELQLRKCIIHKNCSILYKIDEQIVLVVAFWDNRQDPIN
ncbi:MAG: hypothetical protein REI64_00365 [Pedobacter sp.]|uniref:type II toxin-antitoxin system RelE/ParE family toxin n=1 Tax=Pedobacter sp. TaxID=1411316 RepID=UPI002809A7D3|nr:type II toxin-antitoxin system RelE/ParE family toxin [Pedobacter sp.]MDQ8003214.1 hypothetical protein [Pedobacter sp.]